MLEIYKKLANYLTQYFDLGDQNDQNKLRTEFQKAFNDFLTYSGSDVYPYSYEVLKV